MEAKEQIQGGPSDQFVALGIAAGIGKALVEVCVVCRTPIKSEPTRCIVCQAPMCAVCGAPDCWMCHRPVCPHHTVALADKFICSDCRHDARKLECELSLISTALQDEERSHVFRVEQLHQRQNAIHDLLMATPDPSSELVKSMRRATDTRAYRLDHGPVADHADDAQRRYDQAQQRQEEHAKTFQ